MEETIWLTSKFCNVPSFIGSLSATTSGNDESKLQTRVDPDRGKPEINIADSIIKSHDLNLVAN
jgi:hypothetical protein